MLLEPDFGLRYVRFALQVQVSTHDCEETQFDSQNKQSMDYYRYLEEFVDLVKHLLKRLRIYLCMSIYTAVEKYQSGVAEIAFLLQMLPEFVKREGTADKRARESNK